jgi:hypothetical protein
VSSLFGTPGLPHLGFLIPFRELGLPVLPWLIRLHASGVCLRPRHGLGLSFLTTLKGLGLPLLCAGLPLPPPLPGRPKLAFLEAVFALAYSRLDNLRSV